MTTEGLAADKRLATDSSQEIADGRESQDDGGRDQRGGLVDEAEVEYNSHGTVRAGAGVVGRDRADHGIELGGRGADAEEQGNLDEQDDEGERSDQGG